MKFINSIYFYEIFYVIEKIGNVFKQFVCNRLEEFDISANKICLIIKYYLY